MYAVYAYIACVKNTQYTLRQIPSKVDETLRHKAQQQAKSLNQIAIEALTLGAGLADQKMLFHDLDKLAGSWKDDPKFDEALRAQDEIDLTLWKS